MVGLLSAAGLAYSLLGERWQPIAPPPVTIINDERACRAHCPAVASTDAVGTTTNALDSPDGGSAADTVIIAAICADGRGSSSARGRATGSAPTGHRPSRIITAACVGSAAGGAADTAIAGSTPRPFPSTSTVSGGVTDCPAAETGMSAAGRRQIQTALRRLDYYRGQVDGIFGPRTRAAIRRFQQAIGAETTGRLTAD